MSRVVNQEFSVAENPILFINTKPLEMLRVPDETTTRQSVTFQDIVERYKKAVYYLSLDLTGNHHDAEDLSQEVFIRAHKGLDGFRGDSGIMTWLRRIAINTYLNQKRKKAWSLLHLFDDQSSIGSESGSGLTIDSVEATMSATDESASRELLRRHIDRALNSLSPRERTAFVLRHFNDMSTRETCEAMDTAEGTVKSLLFRATKKMRIQLSEFRSEVLPS